MPEPKDLNRRSFLERVLSGGVALAGASSFVSALAYLFSGGDIKRKYERLHRVGDLDHFDPGYSRVIRLESDTILLGRSADGKFFAVSAICPHKGCLIEWNKGEGRFLCPCHAALFDIQGNVLSGPAQQGIRAYEINPIGDSVYLKI